MAESIFRGTTICAVRKNGECAMAGDGQVTMGQQTVMKAHAHKVRRIYNGKVVVGFAGSVADAFALSEKFEEKLTQFSGNLPRAAVELAQDWRMDKAMRKLEAMLLCADKDNLLLVIGVEVIHLDLDGGHMAVAQAKVLLHQLHGIDQLGTFFFFGRELYQFFIGEFLAHCLQGLGSHSIQALLYKLIRCY